MMMKRILCFLMGMMMLLSAACAETADTLSKRFTRQLTGGNGLRGKLTLTASGEAEWLNVLLPFTAADIQIRAIGEKQGDMSAEIDDDDDWQVKAYVENSQGQEVGITWLYGDPKGVYLSSELLPGTLLTLPVEKVNLLYQLFKGEFNDLFFAFDPIGLQIPGENASPTAYSAIANVLGVDAKTWTDSWLPVLDRYFLALDMWLAEYGTPAFLTDEKGDTTVSATYTIPMVDVKAEAKTLVAQMLFDSELQKLLVPLLTQEQRVTYLNPTLVYFYEACIDALPMEGNVVLSRTMSAMGENVSTTIGLPLPAVEDPMCGAIGEVAAAAFGLPYTDLLDGMTRISFTQTGEEMTIALTGDKRSVSISGISTQADDETVTLTGAIRVTPNIGVDEVSLSAAYTFSHTARVWQDESYLDHDLTAYALAVEPDLDMFSPDDPFRSTYVDFAPLSAEVAVEYRHNAYQENGPVQVNISTALVLPDANVAAELVLRITTKLNMTTLSTTGAESIADLTDERRNELLTQLTQNAVDVMSSLNMSSAQSTLVPAAETTAAPEVTPTAAPEQAHTEE